MNPITRGMRSAFRSPLRSGAIILMLAISVGLILAMLVARSGVDAKIAEVKASTATQLTINPAGVSGGMGSGDPLTSDQIKTITDTPHISSVTSTLTDQLGSDDTNLTPSLELGGIGKRQMRFESGGSGSGPVTSEALPSDDTTPRKMPTPRTHVTGTTNPQSTVASDKLTSGEMIDGSSDAPVAIIGKTLAEKNSLSVGDTFTAYGKTITVKGIFSADNIFVDSGVIVPLKTLQTLTGQAGAVSNVAATVDSSDNVTSTVEALKKSLGDKADVTSQQEQAENSLKPLESIASLALSGVIGAAITGAVIVLLSMIMIVRERRREIGVVKAIGASNRTVITQFISEALTLTVVGAIIGIGIGIVASGPMTQSLVANSETSGPQMVRGEKAGPRIMSSSGFQAVGTQLNTNLKNVSSSLTPEVFASSLGIILLIAIVGSAVPAWAIARVRPAEVLRTE